MPYGVYLSASGAHAQSHRMKVLSNNLANVDTAGFKPQETILQSRFAQMIEDGAVPNGVGGADDIGGGVTIQRAQTQFALGPIQQSGRETDFAISDPSSFFVVKNGEEKMLTRAGDFLFNNKGTLVNQNGNPVLGSDGAEIRIDSSLPFNVGPEGRIQQAGTQWELMLAKPKNLGDLSHVGGSLFKPLAEFDLVPQGERKVVAGMLEHSAVSPTSAMMELIETTRAYEANVRMIQNQDTVMGTLISRMLTQ
jgi:flagellar basal-body rod protein FlgF